MRRFLIVATAACVASQPAAALAGWGRGVAARVPGTNDVQLDVVSCGAPGDCAALGVRDIGENGQTVLLTSTGGIWGDARLDATDYSALSCASAGNCGAAGEALLTETSGTWGDPVAIVPPTDAEPGAPPGSVRGISCPAAGQCSAVGTYNPSGRYSDGFLLAQTDGNWGSGVRVTPPPQAKAPKDQISLDAVACAAVGECVAGGQYAERGSPYGGPGFLVSETAGMWGTGVAIPDRVAGGDTTVTSISCPAPGRCTAVGRSTGEDDGSGFLADQQSGTWRFLTAPYPPGKHIHHPYAYSVNSVSCWSPGNCSAVGGDGLWSEKNGTWRWAGVARLPRGSYTDYPGLSSVSCSSAGRCVAVGSYYATKHTVQGLLLTESGGRWGRGQRASLPADAAKDPEVSLAAVSCKAGTCAAVGYYRTKAGHQRGLLVMRRPG